MQKEGQIVTSSSRVAAKGQSPGSVAVEAGPPGDDFVLVGLSNFPPVLPNKLHCGLNRLGAPGKEIDLAQALVGDHPAEALGTFLGGFAAEMRAMAEGEFVGLRQHGISNFGYSVSDGHNGSASRSVEVASAGLIPNKHPFSPVNDRIGFAKVSIEDMIFMRRYFHALSPILSAAIAYCETGPTEIPPAEMQSSTLTPLLTLPLTQRGCSRNILHVVYFSHVIDVMRIRENILNQ
jgi:hypothetical protein